MPGGGGAAGGAGGDAAALPPAERLLPRCLLEGKLPSALLHHPRYNGYHFFREESPRDGHTGESVCVRGYPDVVDHSKHTLLLHVHPVASPVSLATRHADVRAACTVYRQHPDDTLMLLSLHSPSADLASLVEVLSRIEDLSNVLVWSKAPTPPPPPPPSAPAAGRPRAHGDATRPSGLRWVAHGTPAGGGKRSAEPGGEPSGWARCHGVVARHVREGGESQRT